MLAQYLKPPTGSPNLDVLQIFEQPPSNVRGMGFMTGAVIFLVSMNACVRVVTSEIGMHAWRGGLNAFCMLLYFYGLSVSPLAKVIAITFTVPLFATVVGVLILHKIIHARRIVALIIGFIGAFIILRPILWKVDIGSVSIFVSAALWGCTMIIIKILGRTESSLTTTAYATIFLFPFSLVAAIRFWQWPTAEFWPRLFVIGFLGTLG